MGKVRFGRNDFESDDEFTVVGVDDAGDIVLGGFGAPPAKRLVWVEFKNGGAFLNADLADADGENVLSIRDNVITVNKDNVYSVEQHPDNQVPPDRVVVTNQYAETALDLRRDGD